MERTLYVLSYGSFIEEDSQAYAQCLNVFANREDAVKQLAQDYQDCLIEEFEGTKDLKHYCDDNAFEITSTIGDIKTVTERITEVRVNF